MNLEKFKKDLEERLREISEAFASGDWARIEPLLPPVPAGCVRHVIQEGARFHVLSWDSRGARCSEEKCEINARRKEREP